MSSRWALLASGRGSNVKAVLEAWRAGALGPAEPVVVIANVAGAAVLDRARAEGVPCEILPHAEHASRGQFEAALVERLRAHAVDWIALAGFMRLLGAHFLDAFGGRVINIHPSLLPSFPGVHAQQQALDYGVKWTGCTVHFVDAGLDAGPIIAQAAVPVRDGDDVEDLCARILIEEHRLLPAVIRAIAEDRVTREGRHVTIRDPRAL